MDIQHLDNEEFGVECLIRKVNVESDSATDELSSILAEEESGDRAKPVVPHPMKSSTELLLCNKKLTQCFSGFETWRVKSSNGDVNVTELKVLQSRIIHITGRLERLVLHAPNLKVSGSIVQAKELLVKVKKGLVGEFVAVSHAAGSGEVASGTADPVFEKPITPAGAKLPDLAIPIIDLSSTGAVPKQVPKKKTAEQVFIRNEYDRDSEHKDNVLASGEPNFGRTNNVITSFDLPSHRSSTQLLPLQLPPNYPASVNNVVGQVANGRPNVGLSQALSRWTLRFGGGKNDLPIDEFFFRIENLAAADNLTSESIVLGLHFLLRDSASDFYWVQRRKCPNSTYAQLKRSMIAHFLRQDNDFELRKFIMGRRQGQREEFVDFCLSIECLAARLSRPIDEAELLEILRQNMSARLQDRLLLTPIASVDVLKSACQKFERMWASQIEHSKSRNFTGHLAELGFDDPFNNVYGSNTAGRSDSQVSEFHTSCGPDSFNIAEVSRPRLNRPNSDLIVCWNCDDIGHSFSDCQSRNRNIFCYGCGAKQVYKPKCSKCNPGNLRAGGIAAGHPRPNPFAGRPIRPNVNHPAAD